jgi:hypothetical protein
MREAINSILSGVPGELFYAVLGAIVLFVFQRSIDWIKKLCKRKKIRSELRKYQEKLRSINVIDLVNGVPEIRKEDILFQVSSKFGEMKSLFIDMMEDQKLQLREKEKQYAYVDNQKNIFHKDQSFNGSSDFNDIATLTTIRELPSLIEKHREIIGEHFLNSYDGLHFNDEKFGIFNLRQTRSGKMENTLVELELFKTDYFTHRVFRSIYKELKEANHPIQSVGRDKYLDYRPFLTSFGINTLLICEGESGKEVILSKRSSCVHGNKASYHITMNEGLNMMDQDCFGTINIENLLKRGLEEELGIKDILYDSITKAAFYDLFLERNKFEIGITSVVCLDLDFTKYILPLIARDKNFEFDSFVALPLQKEEIKAFIQTHEFIPHGLYTLDRVLLREKISHTSLLI